MGTIANNDNLYGVAKLIVADSGFGNYTTLTSAMAAAVSGDTIFMKKSVTENVTITPGVNIVGFVNGTISAGTMPSITGTLTMTGAGTSTISGLQLNTNSAAIIAVTGSAASILNVTRCYLNCSNNTGITHSSSNAASKITFQNCYGDIGTTGISLFTSTSAGNLGFFFTGISNSGSSVTASTISTGIVNFEKCNMAIPVTTSSVGSIAAQYTSFGLTAQNTTCITTAGTGVASLLYSNFASGSASAISVGTGTTILAYTIQVTSSNTNAITGPGTFTSDAVSYLCSNGNNVTTRTFAVFGETSTWTPVLQFGGGSTGITYTTQVGSYNRIGNLVNFTMNIVLSSKGSSTGVAAVTGLPYASAAITTCVLNASLLTFTGQVAARIGIGGTQLNLDSFATTGARASLSDTAFVNTTTIQISGSYLV